MKNKEKLIAMFWKKEKWVVAALLIFVVVECLFIAIKVRSYYSSQAQAAEIVRAAIENDIPDVEDTRERLAVSRRIADGLKGSTLFVPPIPKVNPVTEVSGIIGDEVIIGGKRYGVGDNIGDAKVVKIEPTYAVIEWNGQSKMFSPITNASVNASVVVGKTSNIPAKVVATAAVKVDSSEAQPQVASAIPVSIENQVDGRGNRGRLEGMSDTEREEMRARMSERFGGGGRPGGMRGGPGGQRLN